MISLSTIDIRHEYIQQLADEFKSDPNCSPQLWIACECVTEQEEQLFYKLISQ